MNAWVRQLAALSVLWTVCEMLLPEGRQQMARMAMGVLAMTALLTTLGNAATQTRVLPAAPAFSEAAVQAAQDSYRRAALTAAANQTGAYCERMAKRAGYTASAAVTLRMDGGVEEIQLVLDTPQAPLLTPSQLIQTIAEQLQTETEQIRVSQQVSP